MTSTETNLEQVSALTLITPIRQGFIPELPTVRYVDRLRKVLTAVQQKVNAREFTVLDRISTVHFARWVIIDNDRNLLFTSNFDGSLSSYLRDFVNDPQVAEGLNQIWGHCEEYPGASAQHFQRFAQWVRKYSVPTTCFYSATPGLTVRDVKWLYAFKERYDALVQKLQARPEALAPLFHQFQQEVLLLGQQQTPASPSAHLLAPRPPSREPEEVLVEPRRAAS